MSEPTCVVTIVGVLQPLILFDSPGVGQVEAIARIHESIDEPVPVEGRLDHDAHEFIPMRLKKPENPR